MTTYYGVWSGEEWAFCGHEIFHTMIIGLARAQAMVVRRWFPNAIWEARAIGEDGLPIDAVSDEGVSVTVTVQTGEDFLRKHLIPKRFREYMTDFVGRRCMP